MAVQKSGHVLPNKGAQRVPRQVAAKAIGDGQPLEPFFVVVCGGDGHLPELGLDVDLRLVSWYDRLADADLPPVHDRLASAAVPLNSGGGGENGRGY